MTSRTGKAVRPRERRPGAWGQGPGAKGATAAIPVAVACLFVAACPGPQLKKRCAVDQDCVDVNLFRCDPNSGYCLCRSTAACKSGESCNAAGFCVPVGRCASNTECPTGQICETTTSTCVNPGRCGSDVACQPGEICDRSTATCKAGCRSAGDCKSGEVCVCRDGDGGEAPCDCPVTGEAARQTCPQGPGPDGGVVTLPPGRCANDRCGDNTYCPFGQVCQAPGAGELPQCVDDYDPRYRPFCDNCVYSPGRPTCGQGANFCLTAFDPANNQRYDFCGVDCSQGQSCPNGYFCDDVIVVLSRWQCGSDTDCSVPGRRSSLVCTQDPDCPNGGACGKDPGATSGFCYGKCGKQEGTALGYCSCILDDDCFQDSCDPVTRECTISRRPCDLNGAGCVSKIRCVDFGGAGGCLIGKNCAPVEGLTCADVKR